jgi:predicted CXXCH cytochrome family protein
MKRRLALLALFAVGLAAVALTDGCSTGAKRQWLTYFFDGVPAETSGTNVVVVVTTVKDTNAAPATVTQPAPAAPVLPGSAHPPFIKQQCQECHQSGDGQGMRAPMPDLCFNCHKDFLAGNKVKHQPVENGECLSCHDPHQSENNKKLLIKTGKDLCLTCHDDPLANQKFKHEAVESGDCLDCHSPHATNFKGLLKKSVKDTCADCHDDLTKKKFVHQPVGDGDCLECHSPHASKNKNLVKKTTPGLCWDCHDNFLEKAKFQHDVVEDCTSCHNPHQSAVDKLLTKDVIQLCGDCHDDKDLKAVKGHAGAEGKSCVVCHDPHVGTDKNLLKPSAKPKAP